MISIVIPTKNRKDDLETTLLDLLSSSRIPEEVVVIDQSFESCKYRLQQIINDKTELKYFHNPSIEGVIAARTLGAIKAKGDIIIFLDDDVSVEMDSVKDVERLIKNGYDCVCGVDTNLKNTNLVKVLFQCIFWRGPFRDARILAEKYAVHNKGKIINTTKCSAGYMACKKEVFEKVGFDLKLTGHVFIGDIDFSYRAAKIFKVVISTDFKVNHRGGLYAHYGSKEAEKKRVYGRIYFFNKNCRARLVDNFYLWWILIGTCIGAFARSIIERDKGPIEGFCSAIRHSYFSKKFIRSD